MNTPIDFQDPANETIPSHFEECEKCGDFHDPEEIQELGRWFLCESCFENNVKF